MPIKIRISSQFKNHLTSIILCMNYFSLLRSRLPGIVDKGGRPCQSTARIRSLKPIEVVHSLSKTLRTPEAQTCSEIRWTSMTFRDMRSKAHSPSNEKMIDQWIHRYMFQTASSSGVHQSATVGNLHQARLLWHFPWPPRQSRNTK